MKNRLLLFCISMMAIPMQANAVSFSFSPSTGNINIGDSISLDLVIGELGDTGPLSLGGFDLGIGYNASILTFDSVSYGSLLGDIDPLAFETDIFTDSSVLGTLNLSEISFLSSLELDTLQSASFTLATLEFSGLAAGTGSIMTGSGDLTDADGNSLVGFSTFPANITVNSPSTVDEPSAFFLMLASFLGLSRMRKSKTASHSV